MVLSDVYTTFLKVNEVYNHGDIPKSNYGGWAAGCSVVLGVDVVHIVVGVNLLLISHSVPITITLIELLISKQMCIVWRVQ